MVYDLRPSSNFLKSSTKHLKYNNINEEDFNFVLNLLQHNPFDVRLKTHKLNGLLKDSWACSVNYQIRIIFRFLKTENKPVILLENIGSHDEVY